MRAFSLVELLVSIAVITVLMSITLAALHGSRVTAESGVCRAHLGGIMQVHAAYSASNGGKWANDFEPGTSWVEWHFRGYSIGTGTTLWQSEQWLGPLSTRGFYEQEESTEGFSCPVAFREWETLNSMDPGPEVAPARSYFYSPAMFTEARMWDPDKLESERIADEFRKSVLQSQVRFASKKVVMFERRDFHGAGDDIIEAGLTGSAVAQGVHVNAGFADGHVDRVQPSRAKEPLRMNWSALHDDGESAWGVLPFCSSSWGYRGRDY